MAITYENRRRDGDRITVTVHPTEGKAVADLGQSFLDSDYDYDGTLVVWRDRYGHIVRIEAKNLARQAEEWAAEARQDARDEREDPYPASRIGRAA